MLPIVFEWHWDMGHIIFMGLFYAALTVIGLGLIYCLMTTVKDLSAGKMYHHDHDEHEDEAQGEEEPAPAEAS
jgi:hypothetical protein